MTTVDSDEPAGEADVIGLAMSLDTICYIIAKAREFDVKGGSTDPAASATEDDDIAVAALEDRPSDPVEQELTAAISDLSDDAQIDLVTLMWMGRDDAGPEDWDELRQTAEAEHSRQTADYLCGTPLLADHLSAGLATLGQDCSEFLRGHA